MAKEIELKFLLLENNLSYATPEFYSLYKSIPALKEDVLERGSVIRQGYLPKPTGENLINELKIRIDFEPVEFRLRDKKGSFYFTVKGDGSLERDEEEMMLPEHIFEEYWSFTHGKRVEKTRLKLPYDLQTVEFDVYRDRDLIVAEVEISDLEVARKIAPLGKDITKDSRYKNKNLAR